MLKEDAERVLMSSDYTIRTHYNEKLDRWTAHLLGPDGKCDLHTPTGAGPSEHSAIINVYCYWTGYSAIRKYNQDFL